MNFNTPRLVKHVTRLVAIILAGISTLLWASDGPSAIYQGLKANEFMKTWLVLSPIPLVTNAQPDMSRKAFDTDFLKLGGGETGVQPKVGQAVQVAGKHYEWRLVKSEGDMIDLAQSDEPKEFVIAYAWAEIEMAQAARMLFNIGSYASVKIWLNGKPVHENWVGGPARGDDDLLGLEFQKGKNQLLLKLQNAQGIWGFGCRPLNRAGLEEKLVLSAARGDLDAVNDLLEVGANVNGRDKRGLTPWQAAKIHGQQQVAEFLRGKGAKSRTHMPSAEQIVDAAFKDVVHKDTSGAAVLVARNGKILFQKGYGLANLEDRVAVTPETKFRIGSITKQFTAAAILKLREQGKLNLDDKLSKFIPGFPRGDEVTIHQLLTHTSGIHDYVAKPDFLETVTVPVTTEAFIESFKNDPYDFDPGKKWRYSNSGYFLLGYIVEKVSGLSYDDFLRKNLFDPLGMKNTGVHHATDVLEHEAQGYSYPEGKVKKALNWDMSRAGGAGAIYSTVTDLFRWNEAVFHGKVLSEASLEAAFTPVKTPENEGERIEGGYGYGWAISKLRGLKEISHGGTMHGFTTFLLRVPREEFTVVVLANDPPGLNPEQLAHEIAEIYLTHKLESRPAFVAHKMISPKVYDAYVGRYDYGITILTVTREDDRLFAQLRGEGKWEIFPRSETEFFWKGADAQITFVKNEKGAVTKAIHRQGSQIVYVPRLADEAVPERE